MTIRKCRQIGEKKQQLSLMENKNAEDFKCEKLMIKLQMYDDRLKQHDGERSPCHCNAN